MAKIVGFVSNYLPTDATLPVGFGALEINPSVLFPTRPTSTTGTPTDSGTPKTWVWIVGGIGVLALLVTTTLVLQPWLDKQGK